VNGYDPVAHGARCDICPLKGRPIVPPEAPTLEIKLVIIGEGPGYRETLVKRPFVGPSGRLLDKCLEIAGIDRATAWVTNGTLCRPEGDRDADAAAACCAPRLTKELASLDRGLPILALGKMAAKAVLGVSSILLARGFVWQVKPTPESAIKSAWKTYEKLRLKDSSRGLPWTRSLRVKEGKRTETAAHLRALVLEGRAKLEGRVVLPTIHPAFVLRMETWMPVMRADIARMGRLVSGVLRASRLADRGSYKVVSTGKDVKKALASLGPVVSFDIETDSADPLTAKILCVGVSDGKRIFVIHPWRKSIHARLLTEAFS
jgi:uracil-DNA glycosylase family 4